MELIYLERYVLPLFYADLEKMVEPTSGSAPLTAGSLAMAGAGGGVGGEAGGHGALPGSRPGRWRAVGLAGGGVSAAQVGCGRGAFTVWLGVWRRAPSARARRACPPFGACSGAPSSGHGPVSRSWDPAARNCSERFQMDITQRSPWQALM